MKRRNIRKITTDPKTYGDESKNFPRVTIRPNGKNKVHPTVAPSRTFTRGSKKPKESKPIQFVRGNLTRAVKDICFVVGGGPSLSGFDFNQLNGYDTIAVNKAVEYIPHPKYFITTDYTYFAKATVGLERVSQKVTYSYFVANMGHPYMKYQNGFITDTRNNLTYSNLYKYHGVIESKQTEGFGSTLNEFCNGANSGHCGIQLALLAGYKKIYLLGFDLNESAQTHFHQSYAQNHQDSFRHRVSGYADTLLRALSTYKGSQEIINLSSSSILNNSPHIKTQSFAEVMAEQGVTVARNKPEQRWDRRGLEDLMVVGYYTVNTPYELEAENLFIWRIMQELKRSVNYGEI